jgi:hypothetical protein
MGCVFKLLLSLSLKIFQNFKFLNFQNSNFEISDVFTIHTSLINDVILFKQHPF